MKGWIKRLVLLLALALSVAAGAQTKQRIEKAADLPHFSYAVQGELDALVRDPVRFAPLAAQIRRDIEGVLANYDIAESATRRQLLGVLVQMDLLEGRWDDAVRDVNAARDLEPKPAERAITGLSVRSIAHAARTVGRDSPQFAAEVGRAMDRELQPLPIGLVRNDIMGAKAGMETVSEALVLGRVRTVLQPIASRTGSLSSDFAPALVSARYALEFVVPLKSTLRDAYARYLAAHAAPRPDIWAARNVALPPGRDFATVPVVIWDSGIDTSLYPGQLVTDEGRPAMIAFDLHDRPSALPMKPLSDEVHSHLPELQDRGKGLSDLRSGIDSPQAQQVRELFSQLDPAQYKSVVEQLRMVSVYSHGTHVAGIAAAGNPYVRLANARIEFGHTLLPDPCPSRELAEREAANFAAYAAFIKRVGARVVNMSWGGSVREVEAELEQCGIGKDAPARKALAREYFDLTDRALKAAIASAPDVLFVAAAGNSDNDPTFNESYPSDIVLPNVVAVGAVDQAGDEASFTSYGPTVLLHANGYQVESFVPGGRRIAFSGTSMAAPQVTNLAAKMFAVKPSLKPAQVIDIMRRTADRSEDGRRTLIHPARALAAVGYSL